MLFALTGILLILFIALAYLAVHNDWHEAIQAAVTTALIASLVVFLGMGIVILSSSITGEAHLAECQERYKVLTYQIDNEIFEDGNTVAKKQLYDQIMEWNEDLAYGKKAQNNLWISIFKLQIYDQLNYIQLPEIVND